MLHATLWSIALSHIFILASPSRGFSVALVAHMKNVTHVASSSAFRVIVLALFRVASFLLGFYRMLYQ